MKQLTPREKEVLECHSNGETSKDIARRFKLSARTIDTHVNNFKAKLGARNIQHAVRLGIENGDINLTSTMVNYMLEKMKLSKEFIEAVDEHSEKR